ncbi:chaplin [Streptomyces galbus]|uniref:Chaplin n=1 Tax=Streptomyces galbus TaxID=33898 RepID=A0ABX1IEP9_STRGB|nr:chaplin [Streptomyces galbus]NKQ23695.1 chaplin [Streptomyces galbus]
MRQVTRKGLMTMAAATGVIAAAGGYAHADSGATGSTSHSPGVLSGNTVQVPVHVPVNVCGNTVNVVGALNPSVGNACANTGQPDGKPRGHGGSHQGGSHGGGSHGGSHTGGGSGAHAGSGGAQAGGHTGGSPGVGSGNHVQVPVDVPVNVCGNSVSVIGVGNAVLGNDCADAAHPGDRGPHHPGKPGHPHHPGKPGGGVESQGGPSGHVTPAGSAAQAAGRGDVGAQLAHTGGDVPLGLALPAGAGALLAGAVLYRRARASA